MGQQRDGISNANKHPWLQAQRIQRFLAAAGVQLSQRLNKPKQALNRDWEWEAAAGEWAGIEPSPGNRVRLGG